MIKITTPFEYEYKDIIQKDNKWRVYRNVPLVYEGVFTDGLSNTPWHFSKQSLKQHADNWGEKFLDIDHAVNSALSRIGVVEPKGWQDNAVRADLKVLRITQNAKDTVALIDAGLVTDVSVELDPFDVDWNYDAECYDVNAFSLQGVGIVTHAAMPECRGVLRDR